METEEKVAKEMLSRDDLLNLVGIYLGDVLAHYGMWFTEAVHRLGIEKTLELEQRVLSRYFPSAVKRLARHLGIQLEETIPAFINSMSRQDLRGFMKNIAKTWVTGDGLWFQEVEKVEGIDVAKQINDACWAHFAAMEAHKIRNFLSLPREGGLNGLAEALKFRIYSSINSNDMRWSDDGSLVFAMNECRVQSARIRKNLPAYPCKSAGMVEYSEFAYGIDNRIKTQCIICPPDPLSENQFCAWRFSI